MSHRKLLKEEWIFLGLAIFGIIVLGLPRIHDASFWDETKVYFRPLFFLTEGIARYLQVPATSFDRPPGLHFFYLPFLWMFGSSLVVVRVLNLSYFCLGIFFFYRSMREVNRLASVIAVTLILLTPIYQVYLIQYVGEPQLFVLYSFYLYLLTFHRERTIALLLSGVVIGLVRETALALIPATLVFFYLAEKKISRQAILSASGTLWGVLVYWISKFFLTGSAFSHVTLEGGHIQLSAGLPFRFVKTWEILLTPYLLLPLILIALLCLLLKRKSQSLSPASGFCLILTAAYVFVFSGHTYAIPRYFLAVAPFITFFFVTLTLPWLQSFKGKILVLSYLIISVLLIGDPDRDLPGPFHFFTGHQDSRDYRNVLKLHQEVISVIKSHCEEGATIMTSWPFLEILKSGTIGYGPMKHFQLVKGMEDKLPGMILWTDYPRQIARESVDEILKKSEYSEKIFTYQNYRLFLYEKKSGCRGLHE